MENFSSLRIFSLFITVFLSVTLANAQTCQFELFGLNPCNESIERIQFYELTRGEEKIKPTDTTGICILEEGEYELVWVMANYTMSGNTTYKIQISASEKHKTDTLRLEVLNKCHEVVASKPWDGFCYCGIPCDGYQVDYYKNGKKRIEGNFKKGKPKGKVVYYHPDGAINYIEIYSKKGKFKKTVKK